MCITHGVEHDSWGADAIGSRGVTRVWEDGKEYGSTCISICMFLMRLEPRVRRFGESDGFDSRWADVDEQGKCGWVGKEASE